MDRKIHWNRLYTVKAADELAWHQRDPTTSLRLIDAEPLGPSTSVVDIGGGDSGLVDRLLERNVGHVTVLDISGVALGRAQARLGKRSQSVTWLEADVTGDWTIDPVDTWHDRAVFHFLVDPADRARYVTHLKASTRKGGAVIMGAFAPSGPETCSGLPVRRYSPETLANELGPEFLLEESISEQHHTPAGHPQAFVYCRFRVR